MSNLLEKIQSGKYSKQELENIISNATAKGRIELLDAAKIELSKQDKSTKPKIIKKIDGYFITDVACNSNGDLITPKLIDIARELVGHPSIEDIAILKTEVRFYFKGRHMLSGIESSDKFRVGILDETKITDSTITRWGEIGTVVKGQYFDGTYVDVHFYPLTQLTKAIDMVTFN